MKIFERFFDNDLKPDGTKKENKLLGDFEITKTISENAYESMKIGKMNGEVYLIIETEVSGYNGGSRFKIELLN